MLQNFLAISAIFFAQIIHNSNGAKLQNNGGKSSDFKAFLVSMNGNVSIPSMEKLQWSAVNLNHGNFFNENDNSVTLEDDQVYVFSSSFMLEALRECKFKHEHLKKEMVQAGDYGLDLSSSMSIFQSNVTTFLKNVIQHSKCSVKASENGKETAWSAFSYHGDAFLYAYAADGAYPYSTDVPLKFHTRKNFRPVWDTIFKPLLSGHYYINFGVADSNFRQIGISIRNNRPGYRSILKSGQRISPTQRSKGFIEKLERDDSISYTKNRGIFLNALEVERNTYLLCLKLDSTAPMLEVSHTRQRCSGNNFLRLEFSLVDLDNLNGWDRLRNKYKATRPGYYFFDLSMTVAKNSTFESLIKVNNETQFKLTLSNKMPTSEPISRNGLLKLKAFDEVAIEFQGCLTSEVYWVMFFIPNQ